MSSKNFVMQFFPMHKDFPLHSVKKTDIICTDVSYKFLIYLPYNSPFKGSRPVGAEGLFFLVLLHFL